MVIILKRMEVPKHYVLYQELTMLYVYYIPQTNKLIGKKIRFVITRGGG